MNKCLSAILMAGLVSVMPIASAVPVSAQSLPAHSWHDQSLSGAVHTVGFRGGLGFGGGRHFNGGNFASGILGFTLGTIIGGALASPRYGRPYYPYYYDDPGYRRGYYGRQYYGRGLYDRGYYGRGYYRRPSYSARNSIDFHVQRCLDRYRSYDPGSDTFMGYDGRRHYCNL
jgi:hypothetical protein